jgi:hypothetical protein
MNWLKRVKDPCMILYSHKSQPYCNKA